MIAQAAPVPTLHETRLLQLVTAQEYRDLPDDGNRYELIQGDLVAAPAPRRKHQHIALELAYRLKAFVTKREIGVAYIAPFDVYLDTYEVYQPDIVVVLRSNASRVTEEGVHGPPDLVVEILSPSNRRQDLVEKASVYARSGVVEYWVVDPESDRIEVNQLVGGAYRVAPSKGRYVRSIVVHGFKIDPADIFTMPEWIALPTPPAVSEED